MKIRITVSDTKTGCQTHCDDLFHGITYLLSDLKEHLVDYIKKKLDANEEGGRKG